MKMWILLIVPMLTIVLTILSRVFYWPSIVVIALNVALICDALTIKRR